MSKGMRSLIRSILWLKRPSDSYFVGEVGLLACYNVPFTPFLIINNTLSLTLSWIIRGVGGVTSDLHLTGLRPTENPLPQGRGYAHDVNASKSCFPLLLQFDMERVQSPCAIASHAKESKTIIHFPLSIFHLQRRCA